MGEQRLVCASARFQPVVAFFCEHAVAREVTIGMSLRDIPELATGHVGFVEGNIV